MERQPRPRRAAAGRMAYCPDSITETRRCRHTGNRQRGDHRSSDLSRKERPVRGRMIKAAVLAACCGAVASCAAPAGPQAAYLWSYARAVRSFGGPVLIGFAHEMNGFWYRWGYKHTPPRVFRSAWRHVVTVFRRAGAWNVRWLWVINGLAAGES